MSAKIVFFFFFVSGIAQESVFVEKDERMPPTENKSCKTRHGQVNVRMALRPNAVAAKENQPQAYVQDEAWPGANAKRCPIGRYQYINGERPAAQILERFCST